jgi:2-oxoisovalerate dehydrogenase E1 component
MSVAPANNTINKLDFLRLMMLSREGDRREGILLRQSKGWFQVSGMGHEAIGAFAYHLRPDDYLFPYYRDRGLMLARGLTNYELALAYFAKRGSQSGGRNMPAHFSSRPHNVFSVATPTGATLLPGAGTAWAMQLDGTDSVVFASCGDAAARQGEFYEGVAYAFQEKLPMIIVVEDNKYGISTPTEKMLPFHLGLLKEDSYVKVDARHVENVDKVAAESIAKARRGDGPTLIWADLDRLSSHTSSDDHRVYRKPDDISEMMARDPIRLLAEELMASGELTQAQYDSIQEEIVKLVDDDYIRAEKDQDPLASEVKDHIFGNLPRAETPPIQSGQKMTMVSAINQTFRKALENDPKVVFFGEDIEDPKGGVFGITKGLSESFPKQVFNSPLAEGTILGTAVGMAAYGWKPVFELQFVDFFTPAWNQILTNMSTLRWRTFGNWTCPLVIYAPYGAYLPGGGMWHSQANEGFFAHCTGIRIAIPSTPEDAAGLFWTAMNTEDPTFILIPKHIFRMNVQVENVVPVPFGKARIVQEGSDVTLVTYGNCIEVAEEAARKSGSSVEIIDLRTVVPIDYDSIVKSVEKTGRLVVVHEDIKTGGIGQAIVSEMTGLPERWNLFLSPPQLVARDDVHIGYNPIYEYAALPSVQQVVDAIAITME